MALAWHLAGPVAAALAAVPLVQALIPGSGLAAAVPRHPPPTGALLAGFIALAGGLAALTYRRTHTPLRSAQGTRRVLSIIAIYAICSTLFLRVIAPAVLGVDSSPWLEALSDVLCVTLGLFVWVTTLADRRTPRDFGLQGAAPARFAVAMIMGLGAVVVSAFWSYRRIFMGGADLGLDHTVFALSFAVLGSAIPEELFFRGLLMTSLEGQVSRWSRVLLPALAFALVRSLRFLPGVDMPGVDWAQWVLGTVLPLGVWWGLMRDLSGGSLWPSLVSHILIEFGTRLAGAPRYSSIISF